MFAERSLRLVALILSALCLSLVAAPISMAWMHWFCLVPALWAMAQPERPRRALLLGWLFGLVSVTVLFRWLADTISTFTPIPYAGSVGILMLFAAVFGAPNALVLAAVRPMRERLGWAWVLTVPALLVVVEFVSRWLLLFPYQHGVSQYRTPWVIQLAALGGVSLISFVVWVVNAALTEQLLSYKATKKPSWPPLAIAGLLLAGTLGYGAWRHASVEALLVAAPKLRVAQMQSGFDMNYRMHTAGAVRAGFEEWLAMTQAIPKGAVDLVVWSEGSSPYDLDQGGAREVLQAAAREGQFELLVGGGSRRRPADDLDGKTVNVFNSVFFFGTDGDVLGNYDKMVPLPFGEVMPFRTWIPGFDGLADVLGIGDFRAGEGPVIFQGTKASYATPICYEAILPQVSRQFGEADVLVNVTNDGWFGPVASSQHGMLAALRATELGRPMVRSAYCGTSFLVEPHGDILMETAYGNRVNREVIVRLATVSTPYARYGDWLVALCFFGLLGAWLAAPRGPRTEHL